MDSIEGFTKKYKVHRLVYYETFDHVQNAIRREKQLKGWRREKKIALIEKSNPRWQDLSENWDVKCGSGDSPSRELLTWHCNDEHPRDPSGSLDFARDFACGLKRPQDGSTSTRARIHARIAQDDKFENTCSP
jgi:hypothetical protein